jgi:hypothetical protein
MCELVGTSLHVSLSLDDLILMVRRHPGLSHLPAHVGIRLGNAMGRRGELLVRASGLFDRGNVTLVTAVTDAAALAVPDGPRAAAVSADSARFPRPFLRSHRRATEVVADLPYVQINM